MLAGGAEWNVGHELVERKQVASHLTQLHSVLVVLHLAGNGDEDHGLVDHMLLTEDLRHLAGDTPPKWEYGAAAFRWIGDELQRALPRGVMHRN